MATEVIGTSVDRKKNAHYVDQSELRSIELPRRGGYRHLVIHTAVQCDKKKQLLLVTNSQAHPLTWEDERQLIYIHDCGNCKESLRK